MEVADAPGAVAAFEGGLLTMLARHGLPVTGNSIQDERRRIDRTRHFLGTDPGGSWVAEDEGGAIIGVSQSFVREDYWMLSQLGAVPGVQGQGIGRELLRLALSHGDPQSPGTIQCSRDPKAMALYSGHGFHLHPVVAAWGIMRPGSVTRPDDVVRARARPGDRTRAGHRDSNRPGRPRLGAHGRRGGHVGPPGEPAAPARRPGLCGRRGRPHRDAREHARRSRPFSSCAPCWPKPRPARRSRSTGSRRLSSGPSARSWRPVLSCSPSARSWCAAWTGRRSPYIPSGGYG